MYACFAVDWAVLRKGYEVLGIKYKVGASAILKFCGIGMRGFFVNPLNGSDHCLLPILVPYGAGVNSIKLLKGVLQISLKGHHQFT